MRPPLVRFFSVLFCFVRSSTLTNVNATSFHADTTSALAKRRRLVANVTEEVGLVLTPQTVELTGAAERAFAGLFDEALTNFVGLRQSLGRHESHELEVESVTSSVGDQMIDSVFVLGAADVSTDILSHGASRSLLRGLWQRANKVIVPEAEPNRSLMAGTTSGVIISNLELHLSSSLTLISDGTDTGKELINPDLKAYVLEFFSPGSHTSNSFIEAARHITDEYGSTPLSELRFIGVGKSELWDNPFSFLDGNTPRYVAEARDQDIEPSSQDNTTNAAWMGLILGGSCVALAAIVGLLVSLVIGGRKKDSKSHEDEAIQVPQVLKCNVPLPTSPVSFEGGENAAYEVSYVASPQRQQQQRKVQNKKQIQQQQKIWQQQQQQKQIKQQQQIQLQQLQQQQQQKQKQQQQQQQQQQQLIQRQKQQQLQRQHQMQNSRGLTTTSKQEQHSKEPPGYVRPDDAGFANPASQPVKIGTSLDRRESPRDSEEKKKTNEERNWRDTLSIFAGFGLKRLDSGQDEDHTNSTDEDSKGNDIPTLILPPKEARRNSLAKQSEKKSSRGNSRSVVDDLLGEASTPHSARHHNHIASDDLYVIPEDDNTSI